MNSVLSDSPLVQLLQQQFQQQQQQIQQQQQQLQQQLQQQQQQQTYAPLSQSLQQLDFLSLANSNLTTPRDDVSSTNILPSLATAAATSASVDEQQMGTLRRIKSSPSLASLESQTLLSRSMPTSSGTVNFSQHPGSLTPGSRKKGSSVQDKVEKRLQRKAEAARASRQRKKVYLQTLEEKVSALTSRLSELQHQVAALGGVPVDPLKPPDEDSVYRERLAQILADNKPASLEASPDAPASLSPVTSSRVQEVLNELNEASRQRTVSAMDQLNKLQESLAPEDPVKFLIWILSQADDFYSESSSSLPAVDSQQQQHPSDASTNQQQQQQQQPKQQQASLWFNTMQHIGLSPDQISKLLSHRAAAQNILVTLQRSNNKVCRLRDHIRSHFASRQRHADEFRNVLTPLQLAQLILNDEANEFCDDTKYN